VVRPQTLSWIESAFIKIVFHKLGYVHIIKQVPNWLCRWLHGT